MSASTRFVDVLRNFDALPDSAIIHTNVTVALTGLSDRTIRHHPRLPRQYISSDRYGQRVGDVRKLLAEGISPRDRRVRVGPAANRLIGEVQAAPSRAEATKIITAFDDTVMSDGERERLQVLLQDALLELPSEQEG